MQIKKVSGCIWKAISTHNWCSKYRESHPPNWRTRENCRYTAVLLKSGRLSSGFREAQNDKAPVCPGLCAFLRYAANTLIYKADLLAEREGFEPSMGF